ncbi:MAG: hypothetical protein ACFHXK_09370 [bacterium]
MAQQEKTPEKPKGTSAKTGTSNKVGKTRNLGRSTRLTVSAAEIIQEIEMPTFVSEPAMVGAMARLAQMVGQRKQVLSEENMAHLVEMLLHDAPRPDIESDLELDNAQLRAEYLKATKLLSSAQVREMSGLAPKNRSEPASRWKREQKLFSVPHKGMELFPAFQFRDGKPRPCIEKVLAALPDDFTPWQIAFWFASGNGWLDGAPPVDHLEQTDELVAAAHHAAESAIG